jgi:hypothetical protein
MRGVAAVGLCTGIALLAGGARAGDGVLEINQACAVQAGCFPGDSAGFPVTISNSAGTSSFRLTSDLNVPDANTTAISVASGRRASIDLNGFTIAGVTTCALDTSFVTVCTPLGSGIGIDASGAVLAAHDGAITGMGGDGIRTAHACVLRDLSVAQNGGSGASAGFGCLIEANQFLTNQIDGVSLLGGHPDVTTGATPAGGVARLRGNVFLTNGRDGVAVEIVSQVENNLFSGNNRYGLNGYVLITYAGNLFSGNSTGPVHGGAINTGGNQCSGPGTVSGSCP